MILDSFMTYEIHTDTLSVLNGTIYHALPGFNRESNVLLALVFVMVSAALLFI